MDQINRIKPLVVFVFLLASWFYQSVNAEISQKSLDQQMDGLSIAIDDVAKDIAQLKKELLFPPITRLQVYLSLSPDVVYDINSLKLSIDGVEKSYHIYSERDVTALRLGGIQRFWEGNVTLGEHTVIATFIGLDAKKNPIQRNVEFQFEKKLSGHSIELSVVKAKDSKKPDFIVKDWGEK